MNIFPEMFMSIHTEQKPVDVSSITKFLHMAHL